MTDFSSALHLLADRFDAQWRSEQQPSLSNYLSNVEKSQQMRLLEMLLPIEIEYRQNNGELIVAEDYSELGPEEHQLAQDLLAKLANNEQSQAEVLDETRGVNLNRPSSSEDLDQTIDPSSLELRDDVKPIGRDSSEEKSRTIGPYKLLQKIGEGGMGTVWMAEQEKPVRRRVALKLIKGAMADKQVIARFEAERQAVAMMDHQNIAKILDAGTTETGSPFFVMELVNGVPINQYCDQNKLTPDERLRLFVPVCKAVQHAHQKGIIHRDLKPSNVLVQMSDGEAVAKVIDFGLAKALQHQTKLTDKTMFTEFGQVVGTLQYMSPEQASMDTISVDTRSDIYSLGVMLYELLAGSTPVDKKTLRNRALLQVLEMIREKEPPKPSHRLSSSGETLSKISELRQIQPAKLQQILRGELDWIIMKALEKDRTRRYETASDFAQDINNFLNGDTVNACPPSTRYQLQKFARKNKGLVASVLAVGLVLLAGIAGTTFGLVQAKQKTAEAIQQKNLADEKTEEAKESEARALAAQEKAEEEKSRADAEAKKARDSDAVGKLQLAQARWDANRAAEACDLLEQIPAEKDYRNFEWYFSRRHFLGSDITCYGHTHGVFCVAYSPDGRRIVSGGYDQTLKTWDALSGKELQTLRGHSQLVRDVAFSPDGRRIASASKDKTLKIWDADSGREIQTLRGHQGEILSFAFSPDGSRIASAGIDQTIKIWDVVNGGELLTLHGHSKSVRGVAFRPDGNQVVSCSMDGTLKIWDAVTGSELQTLRGHDHWVHGVAFSPDGSRISSCSGDQTIKIWDAVSGSELQTLRGHKGGVTSVAFSPDGGRIATASWQDRTLKIWDADNGRELKTFCGHTSGVFCAVFSPDGSRIASPSGDKTIKIWDVTNGSTLQTLRGHEKMVTNVTFAPDGTRIASASADKTVKIWDEVAGNEQTLRGHAGGVSSVTFSPNGRRIVTASDDKTLKIWDADSGSALQTLHGHTGAVTSVAFSPDGSRIASADDDRTLKIWNAISGIELQTIRAHKNRINNVAFSPDGRRIASASDDRTLKIWDANNGRELQTIRGHTDRVTCVAFSPDGCRIASASDEWDIKIWDVVSGGPLLTLSGHTDRVTTVAFSPDGSRIASGCWDRTLKIWDAVSGRELRSLSGYAKRVTSVAFSPDGTQIVSGCYDQTLRILDAASESELQTLRGHTDRVYSVAFSSDGSRLYSQSSKEKLIFDPAKGTVIKDGDWDEAPTGGRQRVSSDGRWLASCEGNNIRLVDLEFKNTPKEKSYRAAKARFNSWWHRERAESAAKSKQWYSATFHFSQLLTNDPAQSEYYDGLHSSHKQLVTRFPTKPRGPELRLPEVVKEALELPLGKKKFAKEILDPPLPKTVFKISTGESESINRSTWNRVVTSEAFEKSPLTNVELSRYRDLLQQHPLGTYYNTLATAEYRMGNYRESIAAALMSVELTPSEMNLHSPHASDFAILAMSHFKLGEKETANEYRDKLNEALKLDAFKNDQECRSFAKEVATLLRGQETTADVKDSQ